MNLPHESSETVKGIIGKDIDLKVKAKMIHKYSQQVLRRKHRGGSGVMKPFLSEKEIERILLDRYIEAGR